MHISPLVLVSSLFSAQLLGNFADACALDHQERIVPNPVSSAPFHGVTPAPDPDHVVLRLLRARQGDSRSSDGRTGFIGWYSQSNSWTSATCPAQDYFAADERFGVCCPRNSPYCDVATACGGPFNNYAIGPNGQADCTDARRIIFCIAMSQLYVLPNTWYRVTYPPPVAESTATVTVSTLVTATVQAGNRTSGQHAGPLKSPPAGAAVLLTAALTFLIFMVP
ncbi:hypothetical protein CT0861_06533 [Colletotrichum tofieldiae]|uniref:Uncharacterized protein n=1 Tax=Colletotrichum tofieldiae TaxID=708197 RepID=A0A166TZL7_9PEZI|nr:hypothetical protein CT0861_06533 [Colletotrichum tofieldiae]